MGRPIGTVKQMCRNGHDTFVVGRYESGTCRACQRLYNRNTRRPEGTVSSMPLRRLSRDRSRAVQLYRIGRGVTKRTAERHTATLYAELWIDIFQADVWCIALGYHLCEVFPELYTSVEFNPNKASA